MSTEKRGNGEDESPQQPPTNDAADLHKIVYEAFGSKEFANELVGILDGVLGGIEVEIGMQYGIKNALAGARGQLSADECGVGINTYWEDIAKAIIKTVPEYKGRVNSGDGWVKNLAALLYLHFGTRKQEKTVVEGRGGGMRTNLMDSNNAGCIRGPNQSWPRATISAIRELVGLEHESSDIVLDSMVKANLVCITFNNPGDDVTRCNAICLEIAKKIGFKKVLQLYAVSFIPYLNQTIYHQLKQREENNATGGTPRSGPLPLLCDDSDEFLQPLPVLNCSSYTSKHVLDKNANGSARKLVSMNTMYHPTFVLQQRTKARTVEQIEEKDRAMTAFYTTAPELRASLTAMLEEPSLLDEGREILNAILENRWDSYVQIIQRLGDPTTDDERREKYETMLKYCQDGGRKAARVLKFAEKLETWLESSDTVLSTAIDEEESEFLRLDLEDELTTGMFSDETSRDEFSALLQVHKGDVQSLMASMKSKLNAWKFNQALYPLRKALVHTATAEGIKDIFSLEVVSKIKDRGMKALFESTAKTVLVNTHGEAIGPDRLLLKLASQHNGWTFSQALYPLRKALVLTATANGIDNIFSQEVVSKIDDVDMKKLFKSTAATALVNTNGQAVGPKGLLLKLAAQYNMSTQVLYPLRMALVSTATDNGIENIFSLEVVSKIKDEGMKALFESTAKTVLVNTHGQAVGPDRLLLKLASQHNGWTFYQLLATLKWPFIAAVKAVEKDSSKDGVCCDAVFKKLGQEVQDLFDKAANMTLKSSNDQAVGRSGVYARLAGACSHTLSLMDATLANHLNEILQMIKNKSSNVVQVGEDEYVPCIDSLESKEMKALYLYLFRIRDLKEGDTHYWKKQMFLDKGINISKMEDAYKAKAKLDTEKKMSGQSAKHAAGVSARPGKRPKLRR